jgi:catechol-2,3-dioxygenase
LSAFRGFSEIALEADSLEGMLGFYEQVIGLTVLSRAEDRIWLHAGDARLGLWLPGPKEFKDRGGRGVHFALEPLDGEMLRVVVARAEARGIAVRGPVTHEGGDRSIYLRDPAGNVVEVWDRSIAKEPPS